MDVVSKIYRSHQSSRSDLKLSETWKRSDTVDFWRHSRMYNQLGPVIAFFPAAKWLTIGDGRYGTDAHYLRSRGLDALATDIHDFYLKQAAESGFIDNCAVENAEKLSFDDGEFDFILCKESYHHFPRPMIAFYEMLRVARQGVILIEPQDKAIICPYDIGLRSALHWLLFVIKQRVKKAFGKAPANYVEAYETAGNYVYSVCKREIEKVALGLNLEMVAFKGLNDCYVEGVEHEKIADGGPLFKRVSKQIEKSNKISKRRSEIYQLLVAIVFKSRADREFVSLLEQEHFDVRLLDKNPYLA